MMVIIMYCPVHDYLKTIKPVYAYFQNNVSSSHFKNDSQDL